MWKYVPLAKVKRMEIERRNIKEAFMITIMNYVWLKENKLNTRDKLNEEGSF